MGTNFKYFFKHVKAIMKMKFLFFAQPSSDGIVYTTDKDICDYIGVSVSSLILVSLFEDVIPVIVIGEDFNKLDSDTKRYVIEHQKAHINKHLPASDNLEILDTIREIEADIEVVKIMGVNKVISSLNNIKELTRETEIDLLSDLDYRINYFRNKNNLTNRVNHH